MRDDEERSKQSFEDTIRDWMQTIMSENDWSAENWAKKSRTSPTNITRFLKGANHAPSSRTIAKLAAVAGSWPDMASSYAVTEKIPILTNEDVAKLQKCGNLVRMSEIFDLNKLPKIPAETQDTENTFAIRLQNETLIGEGIRSGDLAVVAPGVPLEEGDYACFLIDNIVMAYQVQKGRMVSSGVSPVEVHILEDHEADLIGPIVQIIRRLK